MSAEFGGFPAATLRFLTDLAENNNRDWFQANGERYENDLLSPVVAFIAAVGLRLAAIAPDIQTDLRTNGSGSLMRIYRDTRFSADKTPYKTNISGMWWTGPGKKAASPAFGFQLTADGMGLMAGLFSFDKNQLNRYRAAVAEERRGAALQQTVAALSQGGYEVLGDQYARVPAGYDADHPRAELLRYRGLYVHPRTVLTPAQVCAPALVDACMSRFERMAPLQRWLVDALT